MEDYSVLKHNDQEFEVTFECEKTSSGPIVWAITHVNGKQIKKHGDSRQTAYWALQQAVYQELELRIGKDGI